MACDDLSKEESRGTLTFISHLGSVCIGTEDV